MAVRSGKRGNRQSAYRLPPIGTPIAAGFTCIVLAIFLALGSAAAQPAVDANKDFRIAIQPLSKALHAFSALTGIEILVDARHVAGRMSAAISGQMTPREALDALLAGSDLVPYQFSAETITLRMATHQPARIVPGNLPYFGDIQRAVQRALCDDTRTMPGKYRLALKLWISNTGTIQRFKRLDTTGSDKLDAAVDAVMTNVSIGRAPPAELPQPVALLIAPQQAAASTLCQQDILPPRRASIQ